MSPRVLLGSSFFLLAAAPVLAGITAASRSAGTLAETFATAQPISTPIRLERTPRMDGVYRADEWDLLWGQVPPPVDAGKAAPPPAPAPLLPKGDISGAKTPGDEGKPPATPTTGTILTGAIGPITPPPTTTDTGHQKAPNTTPIDQTPPPAPKTASPVTTPQSGTAPLTPINIQPIKQEVKPVPVPAPAPPPPPPAQATFMTWEPGKLYFGAFVSPNSDMLVSIDASNNGFLIGRDNLEFRVTPGPTPKVRARILDATSSSGPAWVDAPGFEMAAVAVSAVQPDGNLFVELAVTDPGYGILKTALKDSIGIRVDGVATTAPVTEPSLPRMMSTVQLADQRVHNLPEGIGALVAAKGRSVVAGGATTVKLKLTGNETSGIKFVEISGEGALADKVNSLRVPSPSFSPRGDAVIDYPTKVVSTANVGYGVLRGELTGIGWIGGSVESSFRVAPALDVLAPAKSGKVSLKPQRLTCAADILSNTDQRIEGNFQVFPPEGWRVIDGTDKNFFIYDKGTKALRQFVLEAPAGVKGTFKTRLRIVALGSITEQPYWITIL
ncbi:MAG TPA: hypothetical protein VKT78_19220 [Fimbriimonadaceae bacterium]|nr:hypothetical protein [Fimbriimonadaceae bacterium]